MKIKTSQLIFFFVTLLALMACLQTMMAINRNTKTAKIAQHTTQSTLAKVKQNEKNRSTYEQVDTVDIRDTTNFQEIGQQFINDMFKQLGQAQITHPKSAVATDKVISAFLGATFGGDVDEGRPEIKYLKDDLTYFKNADNTGVGFGTITYRQAGKEQSITVLMQIKNNKISEIQVGQVRDTSGTGGK
ncbi:hypothetical protein LNP18_06350 [Leuconostoc citreum]|uniref:hypothetical protein n=1 Tax=Leuconostoc citreum TaxID=33964 RepID=UPI00200B2601|nr:hypothetical protein [Leuconostoc citreum]MCK8605724.1 hypothetical protein [Leuconostoc citreum]